MRVSRQRSSAIALLVALAACSSTKPYAGGARVPTVVVLHGVVTTSGAASTSAAFTSSNGPSGAPTCAEAARRGTTTDVLHSFVVSAASSATFYAALTAFGYHGPGSYAGASVHMDGALLVTRALHLNFRSVDGSTATMTVRADGSGVASFSGYRAADGRVLAGTLHWTCETRVAL